MHDKDSRPSFETRHEEAALLERGGKSLGIARH
jgi:hypothetical protein